MPFEQYIPPPHICKLVPLSAIRLPDEFRTRASFDELRRKPVDRSLPIHCDAVNEDGWRVSADHPEDCGRVLALQAACPGDYTLVHIVMED